MKVAWHEVPGIPAIADPSRREGYGLRVYEQFFPKGVANANCEQRKALQTVPSGTDSDSCLPQALRARLGSFCPSGTCEFLNQFSSRSAAHGGQR
jgi:hypothetical protein